MISLRIVQKYLDGSAEMNLDIVLHEQYLQRWYAS